MGLVEKYIEKIGEDLNKGEFEIEEEEEQLWMMNMIKCL